MIIGDGIVLGAGGETASIQVIGVAHTDTVTCTKDGKSYKGKWIQKQIEVEVASSIPLMTSNTTPSGVASASGEYTDRGAYKAFDQNISTYWQVYKVPSASNPQWLQYEFETPTKVNQMVYKSVSNDNSRVVNCSVQYSIDGKAFVTVWSGSLSKSLETVTVNFENDVFAKFWRLTITSNNGNGVNVWAPEVEFNGTKIRSKTIDCLEFTVNKYGTYTITATDGASTKTQDVLVDAATEFEVTL